MGIEDSEFKREEDYNGSHDKINKGENVHNSKQDSDKQNAKYNTYKDFEVVQKVPGTLLNKYQDSNIAKDGGQFGSLNGKSFDDTLKLSREADAYNNKPKEDMFYMMGGGTQKIDANYDRKEIETEEMREMQRNRQLDTNQKQAAQQLQAAINKKDYDAFIDAYKQVYGIELDAYHAKNMMNQWARQQDIMQHITNNNQHFMRQLEFHYGDKKARYIFALAENNPQLAELMFNTLVGGEGAPDKLQILEQRAVNDLAKDILQTEFNGDKSRMYEAYKKAENRWTIWSTHDSYQQSKDYKKSTGILHSKDDYDVRTGKYENR